jgi:small GTP-binding protein
VDFALGVPTIVAFASKRIPMSRSDSLAKQRISFKVVLLGDSGVGKTSLITRWTTGAFSKGTNPTVGANHQRKRLAIEGREVDLFLWDTAGQEQFQALTPLYARCAAVAILTTSIVETASFVNIDRWIDLLCSASDELPPIVLAVNKVDLRGSPGSAQKSADDIQREYQKRFAGIFFVSAFTGEEVENMFMFAALEGYKFTQASTAEVQRSVLTERKDPKSSDCC